MAGKLTPDTTRGSVTWISSGEDEGPDVGLTVGLGNGAMLYFGEMPTSTLEDHAVDLKTFPDGWWVVLYAGKDTHILGAIPDTYAARDAVDVISAALRSDPTP